MSNEILRVNEIMRLTNDVNAFILYSNAVLRLHACKGGIHVDKKITPFQTIPEASKTTGLSKYILREGCKAGTVPHIMSGTTYYVNIPKLLQQLGVEQWS